MIPKYETFQYSFEEVCELAKAVSSVWVRCREEQVRSLEGIEPVLPAFADRSLPGVCVCQVPEGSCLALPFHFDSDLNGILPSLHLCPKTCLFCCFA